MAKEKSSTSIKRLEIPFFEGINTLVASHISKKQDLLYAENARSETIGTIEKRTGTQRLGQILTATANYGIFFFENSTATNTGFYRISTVSATTNVYYLHTNGTWTALSGGGAALSIVSGEYFSTINAENCLFYVNNTDNNMQINADGTTVVESTATTGHLYNSPKARKINYFKDRLYLADYTNTTRYKTGIMMSSMPLGIVALVDGDNIAGVTTLDITDVKYVRASDSLDVYRGSTKIETITVTAKTENSITVNATSNAINSADELWVADTYTGAKLFRWADNPSSGVNVKKYDTFKLSGAENDRIRMMVNVGDNMIIANTKNLAAWNGYNLRNADFGIGCVSDNGYVKAHGSLWFIGYNGIYTTNSESPIPKLKSSKVEKYITGATKAGLESSAAGVKGFSIFFTIGDVTLYNPDGSTLKTLSDVCLEYNLRQENWFIHTNIKATQFATYISSTNVDRLEYSSTESKYEIMEMLYATQLDDNSGAAIEIPFRIDTGNITLSKSFEKICYPLQIIIEAERGSGIQCFVSLDDESFYQIEGDVQKGCTILKVTNNNTEMNKPPRCRNIKISIRDNTKKLCKISRVAIVYTDTLEEENLKPIIYNG